MARKKIVLLVSFLNVAGAQEAALRVARGLRATNYDAEVWFLYAEAKPAELDPGVRILLDVTKPSAAQYLQIALRLLQDLRRARPYAVVSFLPLANVLGQSMALLAGVKRRIASQRIPWQAFGRVMRHADSVAGTVGVYSKVIAVCKTVQHGYDRHPPSYRRRISVVYNGLDWTPSPLSKSEARRAFGLPEDRFIAVTLARLKPVKNYPLLVRAAAGLERSMIVAAGDGPQWQEIVEMIESTGAKDRMRLLGAVAKSRIPDLYRAADCFLLASSHEGQSNALLEAMSNGTPVVVSDKPEQRETVVDQQGEPVGILLGLGDPAVWSRTIDGLAADPERCAALGAAARRRAKDFSLESQIAGFAAVIEGQDPALLARAEPATLVAKS